MFCDKEPGKLSVRKCKNFSEFTFVEKTLIDIWAGESDIHKLHGRAKFLVHTKQRLFEFYALNEKEREIWVQYFCRVMDANAGIPYDLATESVAYKQLTASGQRNATKYRPGSKPRTIKVEGFEEYRSDTLVYEK